MSLDQHSGSLPIPIELHSLVVAADFAVLKHALFRHLSYLHIHSRRSRSLRLVALLVLVELPDL